MIIMSAMLISTALRYDMYDRTALPAAHTFNYPLME